MVKLLGYKDASVCVEKNIPLIEIWRYDTFALKKNNDGSKYFEEWSS